MKSSTLSSPAPVATTAETAFERPNYLNSEYGIKSWLLTRDHKRIAILYLISVTLFFAHRRPVRRADPPRAADPRGGPVPAGHIQPAVHHARRGDGVLLPHPRDPGGAGQLPGADHDRGEGPRLPEDQPGELVHLQPRRPCSPCGPSSTAASTPAGRSTRRSRPTTRTRYVVATALGIFITGFSSIFTGLNFIVTIHRMRAPGLTWFRLPLFIWSTLRDEPDHRARHAGHRHHHPAGGGREGPASRHLRSEAGRRSGALPALVLVLLPPGGVHHDPAGHGREQRAGGGVRPQEGVRLQASWPSPASPSPCSASWSGGTTCSSPASRSTRRRSSRCSRCWSPSPRP